MEGGSFNISKEKIQQFSDSGSISANVLQKTIKRANKQKTEKNRVD